jgi:hypothetical protein
MQVHTPSKRSRVLRTCGQTARGFSLWEMAILLGLLSLVIAAGFLWLKAGDANQKETDRVNLLAVVDRSIKSFVAENGRLPCPATGVTGVENCAVGLQKGWLPFAALGLDASAPTRGVVQLRYVVYRGTLADLAVLADRFNPSRWDNYSSPASGRYFTYGQRDVLDFCQGVNLAAAAPGGGANAYVLNAAGAVQNIAYAVSDGGLDLDGDGSAFDGPLNFLVTTPGLEATTRPADATYDDRVLARSFADLRDQFHCPQATRSIDAMAQAVEMVNSVTDQKNSNKDGASLSHTIASVKSGVTAAKLVVAGATLATSISTLTAASAFTATNAALCAAIITAPVGCPLAAVGGTAIGFAVVGVAAAGTALALSTVAFGLQVTAAIKADIVKDMAGAAAATAPPSSLAEMVAKLETMYNEAVTQAAKDLLQSNTDATARDTAKTVYDNQVAALQTLATAHHAAGTVDVKLTAVLQKYKDYYVARDAYYAADGLSKSLRTRSEAAIQSAADAEAEAVVAEAISPSTAAKIIEVTQAKATAATSAETAAKAALAADPTNPALITASTNATIAAVFANLDASSASITAGLAPPKDYVSLKRERATTLLAESNALKVSLTAAEADAAAKNTTQANLYNAYYTAALAVAASANYDWTYTWRTWDRYQTLPFGCGSDYLSPCYSYHWVYHSETRNDGVDILAGLVDASAKYDDWQGKIQIAATSKEVADSSAKSVIEALAGWNSLKAMADGTPGSAVGIVVLSGAAEILQQADLIGAIK